VIDTKKSIIIGLVLLLMAIASLIWVANRPTPVSQTTPTTTQSQLRIENTHNIVFQLPQGTALNLSAK